MYFYFLIQFFYSFQFFYNIHNKFVSVCVLHTKGQAEKEEANKKEVLGFIKPISVKVHKEEKLRDLDISLREERVPGYRALPAETDPQAHPARPRNKVSLEGERMVSTKT